MLATRSRSFAAVELTTGGERPVQRPKAIFSFGKGIGGAVGDENAVALTKKKDGVGQSIESLLEQMLLVVDRRNLLGDLHGLKEMLIQDPPHVGVISDQRHHLDEVSCDDLSYPESGGL